MNSSSIRLRLLQSEVKRFVETGLLEETVHLGVGEQAALSYTLEFEAGLGATEVRSEPARIRVVVPEHEAQSWAGSATQVGMYAAVDVGRHGSLKVVVEKDFACLDLSDAENEDTFPHPQIGATC